MIKQFKISLLLAFALLVLVFVPSVKANTVTIEADKQDFKVETNTAHFSGNVKVNYDNIIIRSPDATLTSDVTGEPEKAVFANGATALMKEGVSSDDIKANQITLMLASNTMIAQGNTFANFKKGTPNAVTIKADTQEFNSLTSEIKASGGVIINYKDMVITGGSAVLLNDASGKPDKAKISGHAKVVRGTNTITAGTITIELNSNNFTASGGVKTLAVLKDAGKVSMTSNHQMYNKSSNIIIGTGNVNVVYQDYNASGPKATLYLGEGNSLKKIVFTGRSQIKEAARKVTADVINVSINPKNFTAEGNVKTEFITTKTTLKDAIKPDDKTKKPDKKSDNKPKKEETKTPVVDNKAKATDNKVNNEKVDEEKKPEKVEPKETTTEQTVKPAEQEVKQEDN
ncbi:MAG: LptA/OstA family protein [Vampirovibrionia bacterium]